MPVSFLLNVINDKQDFVTGKAVGTEPDGALVGPIGVSPSQAWRTRTQDENMLDHYIDPIFLLPFDFQADFEPLHSVDPHPLQEDSFLTTLLSPRSHGDKVAERVGLLELQVEAHVRSNHRYLAHYDAVAFRCFFNASNVYTFATTFCRKLHYQHPIIYWPTFVLEEATLPLLMAVALTGPTYSYRSGSEPEYVNSARNLYLPAGSYTFDQLEAFFSSSVSNTDAREAIQLCQAALLMYGLDTLVASHAAVQHMTITQGLPALISVLRRLGFVGYPYSPSENWQLFLQKEQIIRLVSWTFCTDCLATLSYNNPPLLSILEMTGDLPCDPARWDVDSGTNFEHVKSFWRQPSHSPKDLMSSSLDDESQLDIDREQIPLFHLHIVMCGESSFNSRINSLDRDR